MHVVAVCVTRPKSKFLPQAIQAFREQTHPDKTLLLVTEPENVLGLRKFKAADVRLVCPPHGSPKKLGDLRNVGIEFAAVHYPDGLFLQFDDDDHHDANRLAVQAGCAAHYPGMATILKRQLCYSFATDVAFVRTLRLYGGGHSPEGSPTPIHGTICCPVNKHRYPSWPKGEDTPFFQAWDKGPGCYEIDTCAELYVRFYHGKANTTSCRGVMQKYADAEPGTWDVTEAQREYLREVLSRYPVRV